MIIENQEVFSEGDLMLVLEIADNVKVYKGIRCHIGTAKLVSAYIINGMIANLKQIREVFASLE